MNNFVRIVIFLCNFLILVYSLVWSIYNILNKLNLLKDINNDLLITLYIFKIYNIYLYCILNTKDKIKFSEKIIYNLTSMFIIFMSLGLSFQLESLTELRTFSIINTVSLFYKILVYKFCQNVLIY